MKYAALIVMTVGDPLKRRLSKVVTEVRIITVLASSLHLRKWSEIINVASLYHNNLEVWKCTCWRAFARGTTSSMCDAHCNICELTCISALECFVLIKEHGLCFRCLVPRHISRD